MRHGPDLVSISIVLETKEQTNDNAISGECPGLDLSTCELCFASKTKVSVAIDSVEDGGGTYKRRRNTTLELYLSMVADCGRDIFICEPGTLHK